MPITVYNRSKETHDGPYNFPIFRGKSHLGNPYTHIKDRDTKAIYLVADRDEAIDMYSKYYDLMYGSNIEFTKEVDVIYEAYKRGEDVYLECYCKPQRCHGDVIVEKLRKRLVRDKLKDIRNEQNIK